MVYCPKCGAKNDDNARFCATCGASLYPESTATRRDAGCFGERHRESQECFGLPHGGMIAGIIFGLFIVIIGISLAFGGFDIGRFIGPMILVIIGLLIVSGAVFGRRRYTS